MNKLSEESVGPASREWSDSGMEHVEKSWISDRSPNWAPEPAAQAATRKRGRRTSRLQPIGSARHLNRTDRNKPVKPIEREENSCTNRFWLHCC